MRDDKYDLTGTRNDNEIPKFIEERDPTPLGESSFTGENDCLLSYWFGMTA